MKSQVQIMKIKLGEDAPTDEVAKLYLDDAKMFILSKLYPLQNEYPKGDSGEYLLPPRYLALQVQIAIEMFAKQGAEGETSHSENGVSRTYDSSVVSQDLVMQIIPMAKITGGA